MSKQLDAIMKSIPSATVTGKETPTYTDIMREEKQNVKEEMTRISAEVPSSLKEEIRRFTKKHKGETEKTVLLKALKLMGFNVLNEWLVDNRTTR
jgi:hypothetical protein